MRVLIVGPQGAGKGTQATLLAQNLQVPHISTGDIFRANATAGTDLGALAKKYMDAGELVPDEVTSAMVKARLEESDVDGGFLLDGFPRTVPQAQWLGGVLHENEHDLDAVLLLDAPDDVLMERMLARGRADDTAEAISRRLALYHSETKPLLDYYANILVAVNGVGPVEEVQERALAALKRAVRRRCRSEHRHLRAASAAWLNGGSSSRPAVSCRRCVRRGGCWPTRSWPAARPWRPASARWTSTTRWPTVIADAGATSNFLHYGARGADPGFPATICASVNDEVVHGIPSADQDPARGRSAVHRRRLHPGRLACRLRGVGARRRAARRWRRST